MRAASANVLRVGASFQRSRKMIRQAIPFRYRHMLRDGARRAADLRHRLLPGRGVLPGCVILGAQKAGTSSLFDYLAQHPAILPAARKEVHFFDLNHRRGTDWYRSFFRGNGDGIGLEATPYYLFHPAVPARLKALLPEARLIVLLRDPVERANSHYWHARKRGLEPLELAAALDVEEDRLRGEEERLLAEPGYASFAHRHQSYRARGLYARQIDRWLQHFPREQFLFLKAETLFADPAAVLPRVLDFLGAPPFRGFRLRPRNVNRDKDGLPAAVEEALSRFYAPHNTELRTLAGPEFDWDLR
jgi:hypothetical protein